MADYRIAPMPCQTPYHLTIFSGILWFDWSEEFTMAGNLLPGKPITSPENLEA